MFILKYNDKESAATPAEIKLLHYSRGYWKFPKVDCTKVETKFIFMGPCTLIVIGTTKKGYKFKEEEPVKKYKNVKDM